MCVQPREGCVPAPMCYLMRGIACESNAQMPDSMHACRNKCMVPILLGKLSAAIHQGPKRRTTAMCRQLSRWPSSGSTHKVQTILPRPSFLFFLARDPFPPSTLSFRGGGHELQHKLKEARRHTTSSSSIRGGGRGAENNNRPTKHPSSSLAPLVSSRSRAMVMPGS